MPRAAPVTTATRGVSVMTVLLRLVIEMIVSARSGQTGGCVCDHVVRTGARPLGVRRPRSGGRGDGGGGCDRGPTGRGRPARGPWHAQPPARAGRLRLPRGDRPRP